MPDSRKLALLLAIALVIIVVFIGNGLTADNYQFYLSRRIPTLLAILLAAIAISSSSLVFQTITNNRIITPSILGFDSLYVLIQVLIVVLFGSFSILVVNKGLNFLISSITMIVSSLALFYFYFKNDQRNILTLLLIGVVLGSLFSSITGFFTMLIDPDDFILVQGSMFANFNNIKSELIYWCAAPLLVCLIYLIRVSHQLDVMWLGPDNAKSLGIDTRKLTMRIMFTIALMVSISTVLIGPITFFGLIVVALTRQTFKSYRHRFLIISSSIIAIVILSGGQWIVQNAFDFDTTISIIINFIGGIYFLLMLMKSKLV